MSLVPLQLNFWKWYAILWHREYRKLASKKRIPQKRLVELEERIIRRSTELGIPGKNYVDLSKTLRS